MDLFNLNNEKSIRATRFALWKTGLRRTAKTVPKVAVFDGVHGVDRNWRRGHLKKGKEKEARSGN